MTKKGILLVAYGIGSFNAQQAFNKFCKEAEHTFNPLAVRHAFTSEMSRKILADKGKKTDSVKKAIEKMLFENYTHIIIQSLHLVSGAEYKNLLNVAKDIMNLHEVHIDIASPLLHESAYFNQAAQALANDISLLQSPNEAILYMGHGSKKARQKEADKTYFTFYNDLQKIDKRLFFACMEGSHTLSEIVPLLSSQGIKKVYLFPFLTLIGKHAEEDMAGDNADSWKSQLEKNAFECQVECVSLLERVGFKALWIDSIKNMLVD